MSKKIKEKYVDKRVTVKFFSLRLFLIVFAIVYACATICITIWVMFLQRDVDRIYIFLAGFTALIVISLLAGGIVVIYRRIWLMPRMIKLSKAARQISEGDYSVRLPEKSDSRKKDEFDVLYGDFNIMAAELNSVEMLKNDFVSTVSHELKTPLASIINYVTLLKSGNLTEKERQEYINQIGVVCGNLSQLVTAVLQLSKLDNQKIKPVKKVYDLSEQLYRSIINYDNLFSEKNLNVQIDVADGTKIYGDEGLWDIVWNNLLSNAVKFTPANGAVEISLIQNEEGAFVSIKDSGIGMTEEEVKHIYDKFYQADTSHSTKGNGLGLATVKKIVELSEASITVESKAGEGTAFTVFIPNKH